MNETLRHGVECRGMPGHLYLTGDVLSGMCTCIPIKESMPNNTNPCHCEEMTCKVGCEKDHTCKRFWCEKCKPGYTEKLIAESAMPKLNIPPEKPEEWEEELKKECKKGWNKWSTASTHIELKPFISTKLAERYEQGRKDEREEVRKMVEEVSKENDSNGRYNTCNEILALLNHIGQ